MCLEYLIIAFNNFAYLLTHHSCYVIAMECGRGQICKLGLGGRAEVSTNQGRM